MADDRRLYDRLSGIYDMLAAGEGAMRQTGLRVLAVRAGEAVLEVGFGSGRGLLALAKAAAPGGRVVGVDISAGMAAVAGGRIRAAGARHVHVGIGDARALPLADRAFDAALLSFTLEVFGLDMPAVLAEMRRVLRPSGRIALVAMSDDGHPNLATAVYKWLHRRWPHVVDCDAIDAPRLLADAGFRVVHADNGVMWALPVAIVLAEKSDQPRPTP